MSKNRHEDYERKNTILVFLCFQYQSIIDAQAQWSTYLKSDYSYE